MHVAGLIVGFLVAIFAGGTLIEADDLPGFAYFALVILTFAGIGVFFACAHELFDFI